MVQKTSQFFRKFNPNLLQAPPTFESFGLFKSFFKDMPVDLEIGCGVGWHAITYCKNNPHRHLIAVERTQNKFKKLQNRILKHPEIKNLLPVHADIVPWCVHFLPESSIENIFILYPNLYPKNPSARFFRMPFFEYLLKRGTQNLSIHLATNDLFYMNEALQMATNHWDLKLDSYKEMKGINHYKPRTHFEKKFLLRNETCYDLVFRRSLKNEI